MKSVILLAMLALPAVEADDDLPYRTDTAREHLPWYKLKPGEFPPRGSEHRVSGELIEADFIHRAGQFRALTGELVDFTLLPFATILHLDAEADLRDVPLGTLCQFSLYQDERGDFTKVAALCDEFSRLARRGQAYRLDRVDLDAGTLEVTRLHGHPDLSRDRFLLTATTRIWKAGGRGQPSDLAVGEELLVNVAGSDTKGRCTDIFVGAEAQRLATESQRKTHDAFLRVRGLAAWIDRVEGRKLTVTLFGDPASLQALLKRDGVDPTQWAKEHRGVDAVVANDELRTYNPPVDRKRATVLDFHDMPADSLGCGGVRWVIEPDLLLEGFRKGRFLRLFVTPAWPVNDMPFGESLYSEAPGVRAGIEEPTHYPYRTDFANEHLPWYRLKPGEFPPLRSEHGVVGELVRVDGEHRSGQLRADRTGELVDFTMPPFGTVKYASAEAELSDLPLGTRYLFSLHQDDRGKFTTATLITDEFTSLASDEFTYRLDAVDLKDGTILLAKRHAPVKDDKDALIQPPDLGRGEFAVDADTRVWKGGKRIELSGLVVGDALLVNRSGRTATSRGVCTDVWVGLETHKLAAQKQRDAHDAFLQRRGIPGWIESVEGKTVTIALFSGSRRNFPALLNKDVTGDGVSMTPTDEHLRPTGAAQSKLRLKNQVSDGEFGGTHGFSGVRWSLEAERLDAVYRPGQVVRVSRQGWARADDPAADRPPG